MEEWSIGYIPSRDGSNYDPSFTGPSWGDLIYLLNQENINVFELVAVGKAGSDPTKITGTSAVTDKSQALNALRSVFGMDVRYVQAKALNPEYTPDVLQALLKLAVRPSHITGFVVRKVR